MSNVLKAVTIPVSSQTCKKLAFVLILSQLCIGVVVYYSKISLWSMFDDVYGKAQYIRVGNESRPTSKSAGHIMVDVHPEGTRNEHTFENGISLLGHNSTLSRTNSTENWISIAIGLGITTRGVKASTLSGVEIQKNLPFYKSLLSTFCATASVGYHYHFFIAYDYNDPFLTNEGFLKDFGVQFVDFTSSKCPEGSTYSLHFVVCNHTKKPAWAQNDAMLEAYISGVDYFYRINDDTLMKTKGWTEMFIKTLNEFSPVSVGVVGPMHRGGNMAILTYDFTHRTHVEIHGFYYPRAFPDWYGDRWITDVYKPGRSVKLKEIKLVHTMEAGQRYRNTHRSKEQVITQVDMDKATVTRYIIAKEKGFLPLDPTKVISMTIGLDAAQLWGAVRNAQLMPVIFPGWTLRIYTNESGEFSSADIKNGSLRKANIPDRVLHTLIALGVDIKVIKPNVSGGIPPGMWNYLVADDPNVEIFLIRNPDERLIERDFSAVQDWLNKKVKEKPVHCVKDHPKHQNLRIVSGQWGALSRNFRTLLGGTTMESFLKEHFVKLQDGDITSFLDTAFLPKIKDHILYHDSRNCAKSDNFLPFPVNRKYSRYIGQKYDAHEMPLTPKDALELDKGTSLTVSCIL